MDAHIYTIIEKNKLEDMLHSFQICCGLPLQVIDENGNTILSEGEPSNFCSQFKTHLPKNDTCEIMHVKASKKAVDLGESYIFSCHAGLNHIVFPLISHNAFFGSVLVGPFLMDAPDASLIMDISHHYTISTEALLEMYESIDSVSIVTPAMVTHISKLLFYLMRSLISDSREQFITNQGKLLQQSRINESIQKYKFSEVTSGRSYPYEKEKQLITKVKTGDAPEAKALLNDLLGYVFFEKGNSLNTIKARSIELCSLLSRAAIEGGAPTDNILVLNNQYLKSLTDINNINDLCYKLQETIDVFTESMFQHTTGKNTEVVKKAAAYIAKNYAINLTLEDVAGYVHLNHAYFSTLFRQVTGSTFKEHLTMVRIEESKRLLANTDYSIIDIAIACGFEDQSYFSKVFKRYTGLTPKQYR